MKAFPDGAGIRPTMAIRMPKCEQGYQDLDLGAFTKLADHYDHVICCTIPRSPWMASALINMEGYRWN